MAKKIGKRSPRRSRPSYLTSILMITLLLFTMGVIGMLFLHFTQLSKMFKESVEMNIIIRDDVNEADIILFQKKLEAREFVRSAEYVSKEEAKKRWVEETGEEFDIFLDENPLPAKIVLRLTANHVNVDSVGAISTRLTDENASLVRDIVVDTEVVKGVSGGLRVAGFILAGVSILLFIVVVVMIDSTIRLAMYSNRFLVKSMQLVGAQRKFITRPYVKRSMAHGLLSGVLGVGLLLAGILWLQDRFPDLRELENLPLWGALCLGLIGLGILISWWSTHRAVTKYLRLKLDELY